MSIREVKSKKAKKGVTYRVYFDYKDKYGRPQHYSKSGFVKKTDAQNHERLIYSKIVDGSLINIKKTFGDVWEEYIEIDPHTSVTTKQIRSSYYNKHIRPQFEDADITLLDYTIIQNFVAEKGKELSKSTVENIVKVFSGVFKFAYNRNYIDRLPYARLKITGKAKNDLFKKKTVAENESNLVAPDNYMNLLDPQTVKTFLERYSKRTGVHISSHMFRHTFATRLWENKVDVKIAQRLLRHESYQTTLDVYTSLENENLNNVVNNVYS